MFASIAAGRVRPLSSATPTTVVRPTPLPAAATPAMLNEKQQAEIALKIQAVVGTDKLEIQHQVDPALIGGFIVAVGSQVIDASLSGQVRRLGLALAKVT